MMTLSEEFVTTDDATQPLSPDTETQEEGSENARASSAPEADRAESVHERLEALQDKHLRLHSEFENFKNRTAREKRALIQTANKALLQKFLSVADDLERALCTVDVDQGGLKEGVQLIFDKLIQLLVQENVHPMNLDVGSTFDADLHEAIAQKAVADPAQKGKIVEVVEKGYLLGSGEVLRFAKVVIGA